MINYSGNDTNMHLMQKMKTDFVEFLKNQDLINLDGKGRPLLPGYGIVTKEVTINIQNTTYCDLGITLEDLGIESESDIVELLFYLDTNDITNQTVILVPYILPVNRHLAITTQYANVVTLNNAKGRVGAIYKQKVPYEPGLKSISIEKHISLNHADASGTKIADLSEFGDVKLKDIVSLEIVCLDYNISLLPFIMSGYGSIPPYINVKSYAGGSSGTLPAHDYLITLLVKDYSSIGPAIVTDGIRMITKDAAWTKIDNYTIGFGNISDFGIENADDIVNMTQMQTSGIELGLGGLSVRSNGDIYSVVRTAMDGMPIGTFNVTIFVKVPVVESRKPFTKDVEGTFSNAAWTTLLTLDGSDEVGGYTVDNIKRVSILFLSNGSINLGIFSPIIQPDGRVQVLLFGSESYPGKVRVTIE